MPLKLYAPGTRKGNIFWLARGVINGRRYEVSCKTADRAAAQRFAAELEARIWAKGGEPANAVVTFAHAARQYQEAIRPDKGDRKFIADLIGHMGHRDLASIAPGDFLIAANILRPGTKPSTKNRCVVTPGAAIMHFAAEQGWCAYLRIRKLREPRPETKALTAEEARRILTAAAGKSPALHALTALLFMHGWRISEAISLRWQDVDLSQCRISKGVLKRGGTRLWKALDPMVRDALANLPGDHTGRVFPWETRWGAAIALRKLGAAVGLRFTPHMARHTMATQAVSAGADLKTVMRLGDWVSLKSVIRYADSEEARQREILTSLGVAFGGSQVKVLKGKGV